MLLEFQIRAEIDTLVDTLGVPSWDHPGWTANYGKLVLILNYGQVNCIRDDLYKCQVAKIQNWNWND